MKSLVDVYKRKQLYGGNFELPANNCMAVNAITGKQLYARTANNCMAVNDTEGRSA